MAFLRVKEEDVKAAEGSAYIQTSGIYKLKLRHAAVVKTTNGATQVNYFFDKIMSYGNNVIGVNGQPTFGYKILESLTALLGLSELADEEPTMVKFKKGSKELQCFPDLNDVEVQAWIQVAYRMYKGEIQEDVSVRRFYRDADGASGKEAIDGEEIGTRIAKDKEVASEVKYEDGVTPDAVVAWKKAKQDEGKPQQPAASAAAQSGFPGAGAPKPQTGFPGA